ncbi:hypothetical protein FIA58_018380 [Flavobacterium jejuense]|uniref:Tetratricopeptide repeat protein n=1 Tax=Flavobacterium jejuense TaxID=1544455 RepID=A0ABX0IVB7_9FLAO|nr:hypothetical protein [Flavobacterium jejuense]NHN27653.1 hypothetical protein [Flavobacterium jejuense]
MKTKLLFIGLLFLVANFSYSNDFFSINMSKAESCKKEQKYSKAIKYYIKAIKAVKENDKEVKYVYFDIADCFYKSGKKNMAIKVMKFSIYRYGAVKEDFLETTKLDNFFLNSLLKIIEDKYESYRNRYVTKFNKDFKLDSKEFYSIKLI